MVRFMVINFKEKEKKYMSRHGENIRKRKDGRWEGRYAIYSEEKKKKIYHSIYGKSYEEVKEKLFSKKKNLKIEITLAEESKYTENILFSMAAEEWLAEIENKNKRSTYVKYNFIYKKYLYTSFGNYRMNEINNQIIQKAISQELSESITKSIYCVVNQILNYTSKRYGIALIKLNKENQKVKHKPVDVLTKIEQTKLFSILYYNMDVYKAAIILCLHTGLRIGELCALKWKDVDLENKLMYIQRTVQRIAVCKKEKKTELLETAPKSEYSKREIPIPKYIVELLLSFNHDKKYIFGGNKPMEPRTLQYHFKKYLQDAKIPSKNFHILRHTFATNCIEGGSDVKSLSEILGHSDVQITLNRYVHPSIEAKRRYLEILSRIYGQFCGNT